jgi:hypothetical protein
MLYTELHPRCVRQMLGLSFLIRDESIALRFALLLLFLAKSVQLFFVIVMLLSPYRHGAFDRSVKKNMPGKLFFVFAKEGVPLVCTYILCTRRCCNISLIEDLVR